MFDKKSNPQNQISNTDITRQSTQITHDFEFNIQLDETMSHMSPEDFLIEAEEAAMAGEVFESYPISSNSFDYKSDYSLEEAIDIRATRQVKRDERKALNKIDSGKAPRLCENHWKSKVRKRAKNVEALRPKLEKFYKQCS